MNTQKSTLLKFEEMTTNVQYAVTLNPEDDHQEWSALDRLSDFYHKQKKILTFMLKDSAHLDLMVELSPNGRLHFHGYLTLYDKIAFYLNVVHNLSKKYSIKIDTLTSDGKWKEYIEKQADLHQHMMQNELYLPMKIGVEFKKMRKDFFTESNVVKRHG